MATRCQRAYAQEISLIMAIGQADRLMHILLYISAIHCAILITILYATHLPPRPHLIVLQTT